VIDHSQETGPENHKASLLRCWGYVGHQSILQISKQSPCPRRRYERLTYWARLDHPEILNPSVSVICVCYSRMFMYTQRATEYLIVAHLPVATLGGPNYRDDCCHRDRHTQFGFHNLCEDELS